MKEQLGSWRATARTRSMVEFLDDKNDITQYYVICLRAQYVYIYTELVASINTTTRTS